MKPQTGHPIQRLILHNGGVWLVLLMCLSLTLILAYEPMGDLNAPVALLIAVAKALTVLTYYMELRVARPLVLLIAFIPIVFVAILFTFTMVDVLTRF